MKEHDEAKKQKNEDASMSPDPIEDIMPSEYLGEMKTSLKNGGLFHAYDLATEAVSKYPENPLILSYYGHLQAVAIAKYRTGIEVCKRAIALAGEQGLFGEEKLYAVLYLNLGKTYFAAGMKQDAIEAFRKGLKFNSHNAELLKELRGMGTRKEAPVSFLGRSNPINKYLGKVLSKTGKKPWGGQSRGHGAR
jgi:tetratricopeptide (TPR) repeat protein